MSTLRIITGDITRHDSDALVCPANRHLLTGTGLCADIHAKAGPELQQACQTIGKCRAGEVHITEAYRLPQQYVIHAIPPLWSSGDSWGESEVELLKQCFEAACKLALAKGIGRLAFPAIGAGSNKIPHSLIAHVGLEVLNAYQDKFEELTVCLRTSRDRHVWEEAQQQYINNGLAGSVAV
jgi:O-acetyl-ADP-ribose deacetylase (regulator of RNase III)